MFCSECGNEVHEGELFCSECGNRVDELIEISNNSKATSLPDENSNNLPPGIKKAPKKKYILVAACAIVLVIASISILSITSKPITVLGKSFIQTAKKINSMAIVETFSNINKGGSIKVAASSDGTLSDYLDDASAEIKMYFEESKNQYALTAVADFDSERLLDAQLSSNQEELVLKAKPLLGSTSYGVKLKNLKHDFENSIFNPSADTYYSLDEYSYDMIMSYFEAITKQSENNNYKEIKEKYQKLLLEDITKYGVFSKSSEKISLADGTVKATVVTLILDNESLSKIIESFYDTLSSDEDFIDLLESYGMMDNHSLGEDTEDVVDRLLDDLDDSIDYLLDEVDNADDLEINLKFYINNKSKLIMQIDADVEVENEEVKIELMLGKNIATTEEITLKVQDNSNKVVIKYSVLDDTKDDFSAKLSLKENSDTLFKSSLDWDKKDGNYTLEIEYNDSYGYENSLDNIIVLEGNLKGSKDETTITIEDITTDYWNVSTDITIVLNEKDKIPSSGKYTNPLNMKESDFDDLYEDLLDNVQDLYGTFNSFY